MSKCVEVGVNDCYTIITKGPRTGGRQGRLSPPRIYLTGRTMEAEGASQHDKVAS